MQVGGTQPQVGAAGEKGSGLVLEVQHLVGWEEHPSSLLQPWGSLGTPGLLFRCLWPKLAPWTARQQRDAPSPG